MGTGCNNLAEETTYSFGFTVGGGLLLQEANLVVSMFDPHIESSIVARRIADSKVLGQRTQATGSRVSSELVKRFSNLTEDEINYFKSAYSEDQTALLWIAACRTYKLLGEFATLVVRDKFLSLSTLLEAYDFESFLRQRALWSEEISQLTESTQYKLRQSTFLMLREVGILSSENVIHERELSSSLLEVITRSKPNGIEFFTSHQSGAV